MTRQMLEQRQLVVVEKPGLRRVKHQYRGDSSVHQDRQRRHRAVTARKRRFLARDVRVRLEVVHHHGFLPTQGLTEGAAIFARVAKQRDDLFQVPAVKSGLGDRRQFIRPRFRHSHPCHAVRPVPDRDTAGFLEQSATVSDPTHGRAESAQDGTGSCQARDHVPIYRANTRFRREPAQEPLSRGVFRRPPQSQL